MRIRHQYLLLLVIVLACFVPAATVHACSCVRMQDGERLSNGDSIPSIQELTQPDLVIILGEAIEMKAKSTGSPESDKYFIGGSSTTFRVKKSWGDQLGEEVTVESGFPGGGCGSEFEQDQTYLVFATRQDDKKTLTTNICTRTTLLSNVPDLLEHIIRLAGEGHEPRVRLTRD